jgi:hypothetical protein
VGDVVAGQESASQSVAQNVAEAGQGIREVHSVMDDLSSGAAASDGDARAVRSAAQSVSSQAETLREEIACFLKALREEGDAPAYLRRPCEVAVEIHSASGSSRAVLREISLGGGCLDSPLACESGEPVVVLAAAQKFQARVVATEAGRTRLQFALDPATRATVARLLPAA